MRTIKIKHSLQSGGRCTLAHPDSKIGFVGEMFTGEIREVPDGVSDAQAVRLYNSMTFWPWKTVCAYSELREGGIVSSGVPLSTAEAAKRLGIGASRVRQLILSGRLPASKRGHDLVVSPLDLWLVEDRPTGRPKAE
jgi:excisionase family DNA binding protein